MTGSGFRPWTLALALLVAGCHSLQPVTGAAPVVGTRVAYDINDVGRVALGGTMGPEIAQVEGRLLETGAEGHLIAVSAIRLLRGGEQIWAGEQVRLKPEYLGNSYQRRFSVARSVILGAATIGGFTVFLATQNIFGSGTDEPPAPGDSANTRLGRP